MIEKRKAPRQVSNFDIEFETIEVEFDRMKRLTANGTIVDFSEKGFGITTSHLLQEGTVIIIRGEKKIASDVGLVKWIKKINGCYRLGFSYRYSN